MPRPLTNTIRPYAWQLPAIGQQTTALQRHGAVLNASDTGTGKTVMACCTLQHLGLRPVIIAPKVTLPGWRRHLTAFGIRPYAVVSWEKAQRGIDGISTKVRQGYEWRLPKDAVLIADEVHRTQTPTSVNCRMLVHARLHGARSLNLSATVANDPTRMKYIGSALGLFPSPDFYAWVFRHGCRKGFFGGLEFIPDRREAVLRKLHADIFPERGCRIRWQDVPGFPGTTILPDIYDPEDVPKVEAQALLDRLAVLEEKAAQDQLEGKPEITLLLREREFLETTKLPILKALADEAIDDGRSVVFFVSFRHSVEWLLNQFEGASLLWGSQSAGEREAHVQAFQQNRSRVCVAQIGAGGVGVDLHDVTGKWPREALICPTFNVVELKQALGRVHRATAATPSVQRIVYLAGTVEENICRVVKSKLDNLDLLNDGDIHNTILAHLTQKEVT